VLGASICDGRQSDVLPVPQILSMVSKRHKNYMFFDDLPSFEYHDRESQANLQKHGISFEEAKQLWLDPHRLLLYTKFEAEPRWILMGRVHELMWTAVFTVRRTRIRLISVRRARQQEKVVYESERI
jgi:uncharacterized DUF497 family protein